MITLFINDVNSIPTAISLQEVLQAASLLACAREFLRGEFGRFSAIRSKLIIRIELGLVQLYRLTDLLIFS